MAYFVPHGTNDRVGSRRQYGRLHVFGTEWGAYPHATDFWLSGADHGELGTATGTNVLSDSGWTTTSMVHTVGSAADFASAADIGIPNTLVTNAGSDLVKSPPIFGDFAGMEAAKQTLGYFPKYLLLEAWISFTTASNNETTTNFGFVEAGGSPIVAADQMATIFSDGTNFKLHSGAAASAAGPVVQTTPFGVRIRLAPGTTTAVGWQTRVAATAGWVSQANIAIQTDLFPCLFGFGQGTSNVIGMHWVHIWYSESGDFD